MELYSICIIIVQCTLHFMLSGSIEIFERGDEGLMCKFANNAYRRAKRANSRRSIKDKFDIDDVETLTPEQM